MKTLNISKVLLINGHQKHKISPGTLNQAFMDLAENICQAKGIETKTSIIDYGYDVAEEVEKFLWADLIIYQFPVYWMDMPWGTRKYVEEVFSGGKTQLFIDDGRSRSSDAKYGSGGLLQGKKYMLSLTWNAPLEALEQEDNFFEAKSNDGVFFNFHKANQFLGLDAVKTFSCHDVMKAPQIEKDFERFRTHLNEILL
jgi:modulator of drug activity B